MKFDEAKKAVEDATRDLNRSIAQATLAGYSVTVSKKTQPAMADLAACPQVVTETIANWQEKSAEVKS